MAKSKKRKRRGLGAYQPAATGVPDITADVHVGNWGEPPHSRAKHFNPWVGAKQIDGLPGEWTFPIFVQRVISFHLELPILYEPISSLDALGLEVLLHRRVDVWGQGLEKYQHIDAVIEVFPSIFDVEDGRVPMPGPDERCIGTHCMGIIGIDADETLVARSSWGDWSCRSPIAFISNEYARAFLREGMVARLAPYGPLESTARQLLKTTDPEEFRRLWRCPDREASVRYQTGGVVVRTTENWSLQTETRVDLVELILRGQKIAWAVMAWTADKGHAEISEFFVWPTYRRRGYGTRLHRIIERYAKAHSMTSFSAYVWNADVCTTDRAPLAFLESLDYEIGQVQPPGVQARYVAELELAGVSAGYTCP